MPLHRAVPPTTIFLPTRHEQSPVDTSAHAQLLNSPTGSLSPSSPRSVDIAAVSSKPRHWKQRRNVLAVAFTVIFVIFVILSLVLGALISGGGDDDEGSATLLQASRFSSVVIACGKLKGLKHGNIHSFKGVPYAKAPVGKLRWMPSEPLPSKNCWGETTDTLNAENYAQPCYQYNKDTDQWVGSEDCLYLNVWSPSLDPSSKLPVMVYFHGGGLMTGSGNESGYTPTPSMVKNRNMVFVTFNYRLNVFGYLALDILSWMSSDGISGNYGLTDQIQALKWVQQNIISFGGDPNHVTLFGQESGATSIYALLGSTQASSLFHAAWLASPSPRLEDSTSLKLAQLQNEEYYNSTGCAVLNSPRASVDCLHELSTERTATLLNWESWSNPHFHDLPVPNEKTTILLTAGGHCLKDYPIAAWKNGHFNDVPLLVGSMAQEVDDDPLPDDLEHWQWDQYEAYVSDKLSLFAAQNMVPQVLTHYSRQVSPEFQITSMISDIRYIQPLNAAFQVAGNLSSSPVYRYVSSFYPLNPSPNKEGKRNYAFGGMDILAFFGSSNIITDHAHSVSSYIKTIQKTVDAFVHAGKIPKWGHFPASTILIKRFSDTSDKCVVKSLGYYYKLPEFDFWRLHGLFPAFAAMN